MGVRHNQLSDMAVGLRQGFCRRWATERRFFTGYRARALASIFLCGTKSRGQGRRCLRTLLPLNSAPDGFPAMLMVILMMRAFRDGRFRALPLSRTARRNP